MKKNRKRLYDVDELVQDIFGARLRFRFGGMSFEELDGFKEKVIVPLEASYYNSGTPQARRLAVIRRLKAWLAAGEVTEKSMPCVKRVLRRVQYAHDLLSREIEEFERVYQQEKAAREARQEEREMAAKAAQEEKERWTARGAALEAGKPVNAVVVGYEGDAGKTISSLATKADLETAKNDIKKVVRKSKREVIKDAHTKHQSEVDRRGPSTSTRKKQAKAVGNLVQKEKSSGRWQDRHLLQLCKTVFQEYAKEHGTYKSGKKKGRIKSDGGYDGYYTASDLYHYCHDHINEF